MISERVTKWDLRFLRLCRHISGWSKDPGTRIGAVLVDQERSIIATGYNGFGKGVDDSVERLYDREFKLKHVVHAEHNAILSAARRGVKTEGATLYNYRLPVCNDCGKAIVQAGIKRVVTCFPENLVGEWMDRFQDTLIDFNEAGIELVIVYEEGLGPDDREIPVIKN